MRILQSERDLVEQVALTSTEFLESPWKIQVAEVRRNILENKYPHNKKSLGETFFGQKLGVVFTAGSFRKEVAVPIGVRVKGVWGRVQVGGGGWFSLENEGKGKGVGRVGGWGGGLAKEPTSQCARVCQNYRLANYPLVSPQIFRMRHRTRNLDS